MRKIKYCRPLDIMNPNKPVFLTERRDNLVLVNNANGSPVNFSFKGYKDTKELIKPLASNCCGYCGDRIGNNTVTVEHFRPKKELKKRTNEFILYNGNYLSTNTSQTASKHGYFLWGSHYKNLLPACEACNTGRGNQGIYINRTLKYDIPYGKRNNFPILFKKGKVDVRIYETYIRSIKSEYPLLFNPYIDNPRDLFDYKEPTRFTDQVVTIRPNKKTSRAKKLKAEISINLLGLNRQGLCHKRAQILLSITRITRELVNDLRTNNFNLQAWATYSAELANINCKSNGSLLGFSRIKSKRVTNALHSKIKINFPQQSAAILTNTNSFDEKVSELLSFSKAHLNFAQQSNDINNELDLLFF